MHAALDGEIRAFALRTEAETERVLRARMLAVAKAQAAAASLWPRAVCKIFGSVATGLSVPSSDVDILVCLPKARRGPPAPSDAPRGPAPSLVSGLGFSFLRKRSFIVARIQRRTRARGAESARRCR